MFLCPSTGLGAQSHTKTFTKGLWLSEGEINGEGREGTRETPELEILLCGYGKQDGGCSHSPTHQPQNSGGGDTGRALGRGLMLPWKEGRKLRSGVPTYPLEATKGEIIMQSGPRHNPVL